MADRPTPVDAVHGLEALTPAHGRLFVVVGVFDGLHRGHLYLLRHLRREARRRAARAAVVTFDAHPDEVVLGAAPPLLCDLDERLVLLAEAGVEVTVVQHFDVALRMTPYDRFIEMLRARTAIAGFLMTPDAAFGHERRGTPAAVAELGRRDGFEVVVVPPLDLDGRPVRSAEIRAAVAAGDLARARRLLGRSLAVVGRRDERGVVPDPSGARPGAPAAGDIHRARLTFPMPMALPPAGRYRARVEPAWVPDGGLPPARERSIVAATALVAPDGVLIESRAALPPGDRLRVAFGRRLG